MRNTRSLEEKLARIDMLLGNHLAHHDKYFKYVMCPVLVGVIILVIAKTYDYVSVFMGGLNV